MTYRTLDLQAACDALQAGKVVAFPTETFYGLGCDSLNPEAVESIYEMKRRPQGLPLPVIIGEEADILRVAVNISSLAKKLMAAFWPGPLTILFAAAPEVPELLTAGTGRIAVRFSPHPGAMALCRTSGRVLTASSANVSGDPPVIRPEDLDPALFGHMAGVFATPPTPNGGKPSTIVEVLVSGSKEAVHILREGAVSVEDLRVHNFVVV